MVFTNQTLLFEKSDQYKLGYLIRRTRINDGISQSFAAKSLGIDPSRLAKIERMKTVMTDSEKEKLFSEFDEIDLSPETAEEVKGLFRQLLEAWGIVSQKKMDEVYDALKAGRNKYRYSLAFEYYDLAVMSYEVIFQTVSREDQLKKVQIVEEYAAALKEELFNYFLILKGRLYQEAGREKEALDCFEKASGNIVVSDEYKLMHTFMEYIAARGYAAAGRFSEAWQLFSRCMNNLLGLYMFERVVEMDYHRASALILSGNYLEARQRLEKIIRYCHLRDIHRFDGSIHNSMVIALIMADQYDKALQYISLQEKNGRTDRLFQLGPVLTFYILDMKSECTAFIEELRKNGVDDEVTSRFLDAVELAMADRHRDAIGICEDLMHLVGSNTLRRLFYMKACELIAAKNGLYEEEVKFVRMREAIKEGFQGMNG